MNVVRGQKRIIFIVTCNKICTKQIITLYPKIIIPPSALPLAEQITQGYYYCIKLCQLSLITNYILNTNNYILISYLLNVLFPKELTISVHSFRNKKDYLRLWALIRACTVTSCHSHLVKTECVCRHFSQLVLRCPSAQRSPSCLKYSFDYREGDRIFFLPVKPQTATISRWKLHS